ncbi:hypothetical protein NE237_028553 [Protea cynaroides]|uniref:C2 domain-containing protein n=1 Tax=Protea cynaroides TaxID=273540 RepID=A0A9Q0JTY3_9MAGN|nr:hypothetical protein NE237_028553 [Protea cynaroides]
MKGERSSAQHFGNHLKEAKHGTRDGLKTPSTSFRRLQTYALVWVNPTTKLSTRVDNVGGQNPTWNDNFIFRVSPDFLSSEISAVSVEIYAVGYLKDALIGTARFLFGNYLSPAVSYPAKGGAGVGIPSFIALHIRRPSGNFHGILNLGAMVINGLDLAVLTGISAIGYHHLMGHPHNQHKNRRNTHSAGGRNRKKTIEEHSDSCDNWCGNSWEHFDTDSSPAVGFLGSLPMWIKAQTFGLKTPTANLRRLQTYALAWVNPTTKLRTRVDIVGGQNPTWNDKFIFRVSPDFLSSDISAVSVEIYAVGYLKDALIGTVRFLIGNCLSPAVSYPAKGGAGVGIPSFIALQIRRPSGRFHGVLNLGAMVINGLVLAGLTGISAIGYRDLMGHPHYRRKHRRHPERRREQSKKTIEEHSDSCDNWCADSGEHSDTDSSPASCTSTTSTVLQDWNAKTEMAANENEKGLVDVGGSICGLGFQRKKNHANMNLLHCYAGWGFGESLD